MRADAGVPQDTLAARVSSVTPTDARVQTGTQRSADIADRLETTFQFINTFLLAFAFIALFVAVFLIFNTFSMLVAQRTRELALLRAVGASRRQVRRSVLAEALVLGLIAAGLGVLGGILVSSGLKIAAARASEPTCPPAPSCSAPRTIVVSLVVGVVVTLDLGLRARPVALHSCPRSPRCGTRSPCPCARCGCAPCSAAVLLLLAVLTARAGLSSVDDGERAAQLVGVSALCALVAVIALAPMVGRGVLRVLGAPFAGSAVGRLARENGRRNPRRTAATASALAIGLALMTAIGVIAASTKASVAVGHR